MAITVGWDNPQKTIIRHVYGATWDWGEYLASFRQIDALAAEVGHPIGVLADTANIRRIPPNVILFGSRAIRSLPPNVAVYIIVSPSHLTLSVARVIQNITGYNLQSAATSEEARAIIEAALNSVAGKGA